MKKWLLLFLLTSLVFAEVDPSKVHPGFKNAIDNGDITTAVNLRRNGIQDIYCPATLSTGDAVKLYRDELRNKPELIINNCSPEFIEKIAVKSCANPNNIKLCQAILAETKISKWSPMLKKIVENEVYKEEPYFKKEMGKAFLALSDYISYDPFSWPSSIQSFMEMVKTISSSEHRNGGPACWTDMSCSAQKDVDVYIKFGFVPDENALLSCRIHPGVDKKISEEKGLNIFDCDKLFAMYSEKCGTEPQVLVKNRLDGQGVSYYRCDGNAKGWRKVDAVDAGKGSEPCTEDRIGELKQSELDFRIFRCNENKQWNTYAIKMGNTIWATWDMKVGGRAPVERVLSELKEYGRTDLIAKLGHRYTYQEAENACPDGWRLPSIEQFNELKSLVNPEDMLSKDWDYKEEYYRNNESEKKTDKWNFDALHLETEFRQEASAAYWEKSGKELVISENKMYAFDLNDKMDRSNMLYVRCVKADNKLGMPAVPVKKEIATSTKNVSESIIASHKESLKSEAPQKLVENPKQEKASAAAESAKQDDGEKSMSTTKILRIGVFSAVALGGGIAALVFDKKAKDATATPPANRAEFQKGHDDAKQNQNVRNISLGVAAAGLVALGLTFLF